MTTALATPHISLGLSTEQAVAILQRFGIPLREESDNEYCYRVETPLFSIAVYPEDGVIRSVLYDDPTGRETDQGRLTKVNAYLNRYGSLTDWECRLDNGWMHYWFNPIAHAQMVYGLHNDVIRFNPYREANT